MNLSGEKNIEKEELNEEIFINKKVSFDFLKIQEQMNAINKNVEIAEKNLSQKVEGIDEFFLKEEGTVEKNKEIEKSKNSEDNYSAHFENSNSDNVKFQEDEKENLESGEFIQEEIEENIMTFNPKEKVLKEKFIICKNFKYFFKILV